MGTMNSGVKWAVAAFVVAIVLVIVAVVFGVGWAQSQLLTQVDQYGGG